MLDEAVRNRIVGIIGGMVARADLPDAFRELILIPLSRPHKPFGIDPEWPWSALVVSASQSVSASLTAAGRVAAAVECALAAADVFDEIEDEDESDLVDRCGTAQALNVAGALLSLAYLILANVQDDKAEYHLQPILSQTLSRYMLRAAAGQHLDLSGETTSVTIEESLAITRSKAGELGAMACRLGALLGVQDEKRLAEYEHFGRHLATAGQIANDVRDASDSSIKRDAIQNKPTIPRLVERRPVHHQRESLDAFELGGAMGWVVVEYELQLARQALDRLNGQGVVTGPLAKLLE